MLECGDRSVTHRHGTDTDDLYLRFLSRTSRDAPELLLSPFSFLFARWSKGLALGFPRLVLVCPLAISTEPEPLGSSATGQTACSASRSGFFSKCRMSEIKFSLLPPGRLPAFLRNPPEYPRFSCPRARASPPAPRSQPPSSPRRVLAQALVSSHRVVAKDLICLPDL